MNREALDKYLQYWYVFLIFIVLFFSLAFLYLRYATPEYKIESSVLIKDDRQNSGVVEGEAFGKSDNSNVQKNIDDEMEFFKSNNLMQRVMEDLNMQTRFFIKGKIKAIEIYGKDVPVQILINKIFYNELDSLPTMKIKIENGNRYILSDGNKSVAYNFSQVVRRPYAEFIVIKSAHYKKVDHTLLFKFQNLNKKSKEYASKRVSVVPIAKNANVLNVKLTETVPQRGVDIVNKIIEVYNQEGIDDKNKVAANTLQFIDLRLQYLTNELSGVEKNVEVYKQQNRVTDVASNAQSFVQNAGEYNKQLSELDNQISILNSVERYFNRTENQNELSPSTNGILDPTLLELVNKFNSLQLERQQNLRTVQPGNPIIVNLDEQLSSLKSNIQENIRNIKNSLTISRNNIRSSTTKYESKIMAVPSIEKDLLQIKRQQSIKEALYLYLLQKREESNLALAATVSRARVIDEAYADEKPLKPKTNLVYFLAFVMGLGVPFSLIYLKNSLNNKIEDIKDVKRLSSINIIGEISHNRESKAVVVQKGSFTVISELFRLIRTNLNFALGHDTSKLLLITSMREGEGKTFFSLNLGISLALANKKVVMLEADLRRPQLLKKLDLSLENGIADFLLSANMDLDEVLSPTELHPNLFVLGAGSIPTEPSELLMTSRLEDLINALKEKFDYIIVDSAPIGKVSDAYSFTPFADSTIFMLRSRYTLNSQLESINEIVETKNINAPMLVLNDTRNSNSSAYSYGYSSKR